MTINLLERFRRVLVPPGPATALLTPPVDKLAAFRLEIAPLVPFLDAALEEARSLIADAHEQGRQKLDAAKGEADAAVNAARARASKLADETLANSRAQAAAEEAAILDAAGAEADRISRSSSAPATELADVVVRCVREMVES